MTGTHVVLDRQQYDGHTPITSCKTPRTHDDVCLHHTHHADIIHGEVFHIEPLFQRVFVDFQHTQRPR